MLIALSQKIVMRAQRTKPKRKDVENTVLAWRVTKLLSVGLAVNSSRSGTDLQRLSANGCCSRLEGRWGGRNLDY
jgi:hypothetical protein